jgi:DNA repair ATPase RecN
MQILAIVVYSHGGQRRVIPLQPGRLNVITGESRSGKSAVLEIVRYCLGSEELRAPVGIITAGLGREMSSA